MDKLVDLMAQSTLVQALVTTALIATCCYLWAMGRPVPDDLLVLTGSVMGFWFGTKVQQLAVHQQSMAQRNL